MLALSCLCLTTSFDILANIAVVVERCCIRISKVCEDPEFRKTYRSKPGCLWARYIIRSWEWFLRADNTSKDIVEALILYARYNIYIEFDNRVYTECHSQALWVIINVPCSASIPLECGILSWTRAPLMWDLKGGAACLLLHPSGVLAFAVCGRRISQPWTLYCLCNKMILARSGSFCA